jgi:DNA polymerase III epsilon subunit-like protein
MKKSVMVDIETLGTSPKSAIISIGACVFKPHETQTAEELYENSFYSNIYFDQDREIQPGTVQWWFKQSDAARSSLHDNPQTLATALQKLIEWYPKDTDTIFANDPDFDVVLLNDALAQCDKAPPWKYYQHRSCRTVIDLAFNGQKPKFENGVAHNALDDVVKQAMLIQACIGILKPPV